MCPGYETCWQMGLPPCKTCLELVSQQTLPCSKGRPCPSLACWKAQPCGWRVNIHPINWTVKTAVKRTLRRAAPPHPRISVHLAPAVESRDIMHACCVLLPGPGAVSLAGAHFPHEQPGGGAES